MAEPYTKITGAIYCSLCDQVAADPGPWCVLFVRNRFCPLVLRVRRRIKEADAEGDGPMVNALCAELRKLTCDEFVP